MTSVRTELKSARPACGPASPGTSWVPRAQTLQPLLLGYHLPHRALRGLKMSTDLRAGCQTGRGWWARLDPSWSSRCHSFWIRLGAGLCQRGLPPDPVGGFICLLSTGLGRAEPAWARCLGPPSCLASLTQGEQWRLVPHGLDSAFRINGVLTVGAQPLQ